MSLLRQAPHYRRDCFEHGLKAAGFRVVDDLSRPDPGDLVLCWNRYGGVAETADQFERAGAAVLVAENCPFGNGWRPGAWYSLARRHVAMTGGEIRDGGPARWDSWGVPLAPWRTGGEVVIFGQRSIGHPSVASPQGWAETVQARIGGRIRAHPGTGPAKPMADDLAAAGAAMTWSSAAAIQALALGVPVWHEHPAFIGAAAAQPLAAWGKAPPARDDAARLGVFRRLAWAIWNLDEISSGEAIRWALAR